MRTMFWYFLIFLFGIGVLQMPANAAIEASGCFHNGTLYADRSFVPTLEPCLSCRCSTKTLVCSLKVCPEMPLPPPRGCVVVQKKTSCCPYLSCSRLNTYYQYNPKGSKIISYLDHYEKESIDRVVNENVLQRRSDDSELDVYGDICVKNGTVYKSGSAMSSSGLCTYCYCIGGSQKCVKPKCIMPMEGCKPIFVDSTCCPVRYDCTAKSTGKSSQQNRLRKTSNKHYQRMSQAQRLQRNRGCSVNGNQFYPEGQKMPADSDKPCDICFCIRGGRKCAPKKCAPSLKNCSPVVPKGQCCPSSYDCGSHGRTRNYNSRQFDLFSFIFGPEDNATEPVKLDDKVSTNFSNDSQLDVLNVEDDYYDRPHIDVGPPAVTSTTDSDSGENSGNYEDIIDLFFGKDEAENDTETTETKPVQTEDSFIDDGIISSSTSTSSTQSHIEHNDDDVTVSDNFSVEFSGDGELDELNESREEEVSVDVTTEVLIGTTTEEYTTVSSKELENESMTTTDLPVAETVATTNQSAEEQETSTTDDDFLAVLFDGLSTIFDSNETDVTNSTSSANLQEVSTNSTNDSPFTGQLLEAASTVFDNNETDVTNSTSSPSLPEFATNSTNDSPLTIQINTNPTILEAASGLEYNEAITLPPSLPNLKIIPFLPVDAVKSDRKQVVYDYYNQKSSPSDVSSPTSTKLDYFGAEDFHYDDYADLNGEYMVQKLPISNIDRIGQFKADVSESVEKGFSPPSKTEGGFVPKDAISDSVAFGSYKGNIAMKPKPLAVNAPSTVVKTHPQLSISIADKENESSNIEAPYQDTVDVDIIHITTGETPKYEEVGQPSNSFQYFEPPIHSPAANLTQKDTVEKDITMDNIFNFILGADISSEVNKTLPAVIPPFKTLPTKNNSKLKPPHPTKETPFNDFQIFKELLSPQSAYDYPDSKVYQSKPPTTTPNPFLMAPFNQLPYLNHSLPVRAGDSQDELLSIDRIDRIDDDDMNIFLPDFKTQGSQLSGESYQVLPKDSSLTNTESYVINPVDIDKLKKQQSSASVEEFRKTQSATSLMDPAGILKLAGCNIYGRMYRVGKIISELSGPCIECKCTEVGVNCSPRSC